MAGSKVTHCVCEDISLAVMLRWAERNDAYSRGAIARALGCSTHCGMCEPFIEYALATGETEVPFPCPDLPEDVRRKFE